MLRKAQPDCLRYFISLLRSDGSDTAQSDELVRVLVEAGNYDKSLASETVHNAFQDGLLVAATPNGSGSSLIPKFLRLPRLEEVKKDFTHDFYCFECHLPGALIHCRQCPRSFHRLCFRKDPEKPKYPVPSGKFQKNRPPAFSSDTDNESEGEGTMKGSTSIDYESDGRAASSLLQMDPAALSSWAQQRFAEEITVDSTSSPIQTVFEGLDNEVEGTTTTASHTLYAKAKDNSKLFGEEFDIERKTKVEVVCLGEVRPPTRKRRRTIASNLSYKSEILNNEERESDMDLCTCCRLLKTAELHHPPNMQTDELCHLIEFTFERNRTWVNNDVLAYLESLKLPSRCISAVTKLLLKFNDKSLDNIAAKLKALQYKFLTEFLTDVLDVQHNIGVFFGPNGTDMEATKWMVRDIGYDLAEIRRCPDCFRYSHEKHSSAWFAKPCVQRHELVFAKHSGFPYWPAKVIRVLSNNKYDVRFFGGSHSRALIESRYIRPIDTDIKSLKIGSKPAIRKALEELRIHQVLSAYPPSIFSFHANKSQMEEIIRSALQRTANQFIVNPNKGRKPPARRQTVCNTVANISMNNVLDISGNVQAIHNVQSTVLSDSGFLNDTEARLKARRNQKMPKKRSTRSTNSLVDAADLKKVQDQLDDAIKMVAATQQKNEKLLANIDKLKEAVKKYEHEKKILKRKQWCYWCLNEAIYLCCFRAAYCSQICQSRHWKDGHSKVCKNSNDQRQTTPTT